MLFKWLTRFEAVLVLALVAVCLLPLLVVAIVLCVVNTVVQKITADVVNLFKWMRRKTYPC